MAYENTIFYWKCDSAVATIFDIADGSAIDLSTTSFVPGTIGNAINIQASSPSAYPSFTASHGSNIDFNLGSIIFSCRHTGTYPSQFARLFSLGGNNLEFTAWRANATEWVFYYAEEEYRFTINIDIGEHKPIFTWNYSAPNCTVKMIVNGALIDSITLAPARLPAPTSPSTTFYVGNFIPPNNRSWAGWIDEFYILDTDTPVEVLDADVLPTAFFNAMTLWHMKSRAVRWTNGSTVDSTFIAFGKDANPATGLDHVSVGEYNHLTNTWAEYNTGITMQPSTTNGHGTPTLAIDSNGYLQVTIGSYTSGSNRLYTVRSTSGGGDASTWDDFVVVKVGDGDSDYTYPLVEVGSNNDLVCLYRESFQTGPQFRRIVWDESAEDPDAWGDDLAVIQSLHANLNERPYAQTYLDTVYNSNRLYVVWHQDNLAVSPVSYQNIYLVFTDDPTAATPTWSAMDGTPVTSQIPFIDGSDYRIFNSASPPPGFGTAWEQCYIGSVGVDESGFPHIVFGLGDTSQTNRIVHGKWTGSTWEFNNVDISNDLNNPNSQYGRAITDADIRVKSSTEVSIATPKNFFGVAEITEYDSTDLSIWDETQLTNDGIVSSAFVTYPRNMDIIACRLLFMTGGPSIHYDGGHNINARKGETLISGVVIECTSVIVGVDSYSTEISTTVLCSVGSVSMVAYEAEVETGTVVDCSVGGIVLKGLNADVESGTAISCTIGSVEVIKHNATITTSAEINCTVGAVVISGFNVEIDEGVTIECDTGLVSIESFKAEISTTIECGTGAVSMVGFNTEIAFATIIECAVGEVVVNKLDTTIGTSVTIEVSTGIVGVTPFKANVELPSVVECSTGVVGIDSFDAAIFTTLTIEATTGNVIATGFGVNIFVEVTGVPQERIRYIEKDNRIVIITR